jgi:hypothetical protein
MDPIETWWFRIESQHLRDIRDVFIFPYRAAIGRDQGPFQTRPWLKGGALYCFSPAVPSSSLRPRQRLSFHSVMIRSSITLSDTVCLLLIDSYLCAALDPMFWSTPTRAGWGIPWRSAGQPFRVEVDGEIDAKEAESTGGIGGSGTSSKTLWPTAPAAIRWSRTGYRARGTGCRPAMTHRGSGGGRCSRQVFNEDGKSFRLLRLRYNFLRRDLR